MTAAPSPPIGFHAGIKNGAEVVDRHLRSGERRVQFRRRPNRVEMVTTTPEVGAAMNAAPLQHHLHGGGKFAGPLVQIEQVADDFGQGRVTHHSPSLNPRRRSASLISTLTALDSDRFSAAAIFAMALLISGGTARTNKLGFLVIVVSLKATRYRQPLTRMASNKSPAGPG
jgi:hypothetical protein